MTPEYIVLGSGGHARVLIEALKSTGARIGGCVDPRSERWGSDVDGVKVIGGDELLENRDREGVLLVNGVGAAGSTAVRQEVFEKFSAAGFRFPPIKSASCHFSDRAQLGDGGQALTRAIIHPGTAIGTNSIVNTAAVIEHDCSIGSHCFIGPGAILCGGVRLSDSVFVGAGAIILPGITVGSRAHIGAGSIVHKNVPSDGKARGSGVRTINHE